MYIKYALLVFHQENNLGKIKQILTKFDLNTPATHTSTMLTFINVQF